MMPLGWPTTSASRLPIWPADPVPTAMIASTYELAKEKMWELDMILRLKSRNCHSAVHMM